MCTCDLCDGHLLTFRTSKPLGSLQSVSSRDHIGDYEVRTAKKLFAASFAMFEVAVTMKFGDPVLEAVESQIWHVCLVDRSDLLVTSHSAYAVHRSSD